MKPIRLVPENTDIDFARLRFFGLLVSAILILGTAVALVWPGLNLGIDFKGGILMEIRAEQPIDVGQLRGNLNGLGLGEVQIQQFGSPNDALVRIGQQTGGDAAQNEAVQQVRAALGDGYEYRRVELVGPRVGGELMRDGIIATALALLAIAAYVAFRFEWQFGVSALLATFHDVFVTLGLFCVLQLEFDLTAVAALLTLAGYSINDTVVVFDRMREQMRKHKSADLKTIINMSVNQTLGRTILTSGTTLLAILPLLMFGGSALANFTIALFWGILVGTFSSVYVAGALLLYLPQIRRGDKEDRPDEEAARA
ncbi:protein translocase subunit SecF [Indioceanicola profundi]|uniref:protein translocase subunit SecF n=1 Tax=Indioceanicola profundi TaxID=2220096 RepID=UPI000E6AB3D5|nr:protein translocase subunit SecF [Indioceanicola profundi]